MKFFKSLKSPFGIFLSLNTISIILFIVFAITTILVMMNISPFPERLTISEMTQEMIDIGEDKSLITMYILIALTAISFIGLIITNCGVLFNLFSFFDLYNEKHIYHEQRNSFLKYLGYFIFSLIYFIFPPILLWYAWFIFYKEHLLCFNYTSFVLLRLKTTNKIKKLIWSIFICLIPTTLVLTPILVILNSNKNSLSYLIPNENVKKYLTLSNNKQNVIFLYFDRTQGVTWNFLLLVDKLINKDNSFINLFPEFTSYLNVVSTASLTKISTPALYSGAMFNVAMKQSTSKNIDIQPTTNNNLTENQWVFYALYNFAKMLMSNDIKNITYDNLPYYANDRMSGGFGNMYELYKDFKKINMNINTMTNAKIANHVLNRYVKLMEGDNVYDGEVLNALPNLLQFNNTNSGTYFSFFSQQTHENYVVKRNNKYQKITGKEYFIESIWTVIQDLKKLLLRLKSESFVDNNNKPVFDKNNNLISVYDKSMIYIVSDHGYQVKYLNIFKKLCNYLLSNSIINENQYNSVFNFDYMQYNPILNIKKPKYDVNDNLINDQRSFKFNADQVLCLSDVPVIIENNLHEYLNKSANSFFTSDKIINSVTPKSYQQKLKNQVLNNPLNPQFNSLSKNNMINRIFSITTTSDWRMHYNSKTFEIISEYKWLINSLVNGFWSNNNLIKIW